MTPMPRSRASHQLSICEKALDKILPVRTPLPPAMLPWPPVSAAEPAPPKGLLVELHRMDLHSPHSQATFSSRICQHTGGSHDANLAFQRSCTELTILTAHSPLNQANPIRRHADLPRGALLSHPTVYPTFWAHLPPLEPPATMSRFMMTTQPKTTLARKSRIP